MHDDDGERGMGKAILETNKMGMVRGETTMERCTSGYPDIQQNTDKCTKSLLPQD